MFARTKLQPESLIDFFIKNKENSHQNDQYMDEILKRIDTHPQPTLIIHQNTKNFLAILTAA